MITFINRNNLFKYNKKHVKPTNHQLFKILSLSNFFIVLFLLLHLHNLHFVEASSKQQSIVDQLSSQPSVATVVEQAEQASHFSAVKIYLNHEDYQRKEKGKSKNFFHNDLKRIVLLSHSNKSFYIL